MSGVSIGRWGFFRAGEEGRTGPKVEFYFKIDLVCVTRYKRI